MSFENRKRSKDESKITIIGENIDTLIGETLNMAVIKTNLEAVKKDRSERSFRYGSDRVFKSIKCVTLLAVTWHKKIFLTSEVIKNGIPMLLSKETIKKQICMLTLLTIK